MILITFITTCIAILAIGYILAKKETIRQLEERYGKISVKEQELNKRQAEINIKKQKIESFQKKYGNLIEKDKILMELESNIKEDRKTLAEIKKEITLLISRLQELEEQEFIVSHGLYESKYDFGTSEEYKEKLDTIKIKQKEKIKNKIAAICHTEWTVEGSQAKGRKMINAFLKLILRAFNGECDTAVLKVKYNNIKTLEKRINKSYEALNKLSETNKCEITKEYLGLRLQELYLTHEFQEKKKEEQEEQRRIKEQMREEEKARREIEKIKEKTEEEEEKYTKELEKARQEITQLMGQEKDKLQEKIEYLRQQLEEATINKERAVSRAQLTKSGHVYIISNIGSFGSNIYKIGMTRRLDPNDRIKELSSASVPFPFDIHTMIFSDNAPELENRLHQIFDEKRVNKANDRKEFFSITLDEIVETVKNIAREENWETKISFTKVAEAEEYRKTVAMKK
ncbi:DUF4041 domain-containing protein [Spirulina sp. 06S082]|uniref:DUF4041 domain-containing protein n=1 Tax=Spirulina sp. 06S082 TaxID=3110248 RepID=UPI002B1FE106|nr:DUF4041 domain-containing protein [Spirulina sp. 06S082]MEA5468583.1 DUF4041 domain-containing protein [Spirulina sp. 06S082]